MSDRDAAGSSGGPAAGTLTVVTARARRWVLPLLAASVLVVALYVVAWATEPAPRVLRADFLNAYLGGQILRDGHGAQLYDLGLQAHIYRDLTAPNDYPLLAFYDTPSAAVMAVPFTAIGVGDAWRAFSLLQLGSLVAAAVIAMRAAPWPARTPAVLRLTTVAVGVAGFSTDVLFLQGQWSGLFALGVALGYRELRHGHEAWAAFWLLTPVLAVKPNLAIGVGAFLVGWGGWRVVRGAASGVAVVVATSLLVGGAGIFASFVHADMSSRSLWPMASMNGITGITGRLLGDGNAADTIGFAACLLLGSIAIPLGHRARSSGRLEPALAGAVALGLLASPHLYLHDIAMLTPAAIWFMVWAYGRDAGESAMRAPRRFIAAIAGWIALNVAAGAQPIDYHEVPGRLVPWFLLAAAATAVVAQSRSKRSTSSTNTVAPPTSTSTGKGTMNSTASAPVGVGLICSTRR